MANYYTEVCVAFPYTETEERLSELSLLYYQTVAEEFNTTEAFEAIRKEAESRIAALRAEYEESELSYADFADCWLGPLCEMGGVSYGELPCYYISDGVLYLTDDAGDVSPDLVALWLRIYLRFFGKDETLTFEYSTRCDHHRPDSFGGGFGIVTKDVYNVYDVSWVRMKMLEDKTGLLSLLLNENSHNLPIAVSDDGDTILHQPTKASIRYTRNKTSIDLLPRDRSGNSRSQKMIVLE